MYYAMLDENNICVSVQESPTVIDSDDLMELDSYDTGVLGKMWTGSEWIENPNPPEPPEPSTEPTNQDIMDALTAMQGDQVPAATLDAAYREGVNAYV